MASIKLRGDTSGELVIEAPAVAGTNTLTLPAASGNILTDAAALPAIDGSNLTNLPAADSLSTATGSAPSYSARAWVNFNGTGTVAIRASGNVSSITDNGTGTYTVNFSTAMSDGNYAIGGLANHNTTATNSRGFVAAWSTQMLTTSCRIRALGDGGSLIDFEQMNLIVLR